MIQYCTICYLVAITEFEENTALVLCDDCLAKRNAFIDQNHSNQNDFLQNWERLRVAEHHPELGKEPADGETCEADDYFEKYLVEPSEQQGDGRSMLTADVTFGELSTVGTYATLAEKVHAIRSQLTENSDAMDFHVGIPSSDGALDSASGDQNSTPCTETNSKEGMLDRAL
jgi:hypothetical protein